MWIRQCELDAASDTRSPIPTRIASNEEFIPPPQSNEQKAVEERLRDLSDRNARALGLDRRRFLRTGPGMAAALIAMNEVFGAFFAIAESLRDRERRQLVAAGVVGAGVADAKLVIPFQRVGDAIEHAGLIRIGSHDPAVGIAQLHLRVKRGRAGISQRHHQRPPRRH